MNQLDSPRGNINVWGTMPVADFKVLLVEDSPLLSERVLELISEIQGVTTIGTATTEADAIKAVGTKDADAVVLDLRLRHGTGFGVLRYIQSLSNPPAVIVMTNYALPQYRIQAETLGARYFLDKLQQMDQLPTLLAILRDERQA